MSHKTPLVSVTSSAGNLYVSTVSPTVGSYGFVIMRYSLNCLIVRCEDSDRESVLVQRVAREIRILKALEHPNIIRLYEQVGVEDLDSTHRKCS